MVVVLVWMPLEYLLGDLGRPMLVVVEGLVDLHCTLNFHSPRGNQGGMVVDSLVDSPVDSLVDSLVDSPVDSLVDSRADSPFDSRADSSVVGGRMD